VGDNTAARQIVIDHGRVDPILPAKKGIYQKQSVKNYTINKNCKKSLHQEVVLLKIN
jgi:hypothetical protein